MGICQQKMNLHSLSGNPEYGTRRYVSQKQHKNKRKSQPWFERRSVVPLVFHQWSSTNFKIAGKKPAIRRQTIDYGNRVSEYSVTVEDSDYRGEIAVRTNSEELTWKAQQINRERACEDSERKLRDALRNRYLWRWKVIAHLAPPFLTIQTGNELQYSHNVGRSNSKSRLSKTWNK